MKFSSQVPRGMSSVPSSHGSMPGLQHVCKYAHREPVIVSGRFDTRCQRNTGRGKQAVQQSSILSLLHLQSARRETCHDVLGTHHPHVRVVLVEVVPMGLVDSAAQASAVKRLLTQRTKELTQW